MPRYLLETEVVATPQIDAAVRLASQRFPEIAVEDISTDHAAAQTFWVCRAPSKTHVVRWAKAAHLAVVGQPGTASAVPELESHR
jgi:hypothetical protein